MTPPNRLLRSPATLFALAAFALPLASHAAFVSPWTQYSGSITSGLNTSSPVFGNGTADSADGQTIYASTPTYSLASVGDSIALSGTVTFEGLVTPQSDQFRFGFYDANGQTGATGWLGYFATNSGTSTGDTRSRLWERNNPNTGSFGSGAGATTLAFAGATPSNTAFASGTYAYSLVATRTVSGLDLSWSIIETGAGADYSVSGTFSDVTAQTFSFNRVGFFTGGGLNAGRVSLADVDLTFTPAAVPEPSSAALAAGLLGIGFVATRRKRG